ncbi:hypothetical protein [Hyphomicrobium sp. CS1GBMeth3]|uniref:hypothetical protein n=1 Tax=Hyphomicrobium sp. CS1GBMeth3 TaxID=1892845 RepID=UPI0009318A29|nr:hypothetical protein [Hyphomicrobium sp. CS1GBMeth3]
MSARRRHIREFIEALAGPAVFLSFFGIVYVLISVACSLSVGNDPLVAEPAAVIAGMVLGLTLVAFLLLAIVCIDASRRLVEAENDKEDTFLAKVTLALAALSGLAVLWTALPAATVSSVC